MVEREGGRMEEVVERGREDGRGGGEREGGWKRWWREGGRMEEVVERVGLGRLC